MTVSMLDAELFDKLASLAKVIRECDEPFGGLQLVLAGDFFQLPPVIKNAPSRVKFAFEAQFWQESLDAIFNLDTVFRQSEPGERCRSAVIPLPTLMPLIQSSPHCSTESGSTSSPRRTSSSSASCNVPYSVPPASYPRNCA
jgi:hypothetical protein